MVVSPQPDEDSLDYHTIDEATAKQLLSAIDSDQSFEDLSEKMKGLGSRSRLRILSLLNQRDLCVHDLSTLLEMSQSAVSHQLKELRNKGLLNRRKEGRVVYYSVHDEQLDTLLKTLRNTLFNA